MNTKKKKSLIYPVLFMTALTLFTTLILAILNQSTLDIVKANQELELRKKILYVFNSYDENMTNDEVNKLLKKRLQKKTIRKTCQYTLLSQMKDL